MATEKPDGKFATAQDLRRSFGTRWSRLVKPATLQKLMRHADIKTIEYYVAQDAGDIATELWAGHDSAIHSERDSEAETSPSID